MSAHAPDTLAGLTAARREMSTLCAALGELRASGVTQLETLLASAAIGLRHLDDQLVRLCVADDAVRQSAAPVRI